LGDDSFFVDNAGDKAIELTGQGTDSVYSSVTFSLGGQYIENLTLTGTASINATGNGLNNTLVGNSGNNVLNGGVGADVMSGGLGNDTYYIDNAGDQVTELTGQGTDTVISSLSYALGDFIENLTLTGSANLNGVGNALGNTITGNAGNNTIVGGQGADTMIGGLGNDTFYVDNVGDKVVELTGQGTDSVVSSVSFSLAGQYIENLTLGGTANINATGNGLNNTIVGNAGNNTLDGFVGNDTLTGGAGADIFLFGAGSGKDTITDFSASQGDTLNLHAYNQANVILTQVGNDTVIDLGGGNTITVTGTLKADITSHITW
jgi:Ca2+-binding RTX toxin-like protein